MGEFYKYFKEFYGHDGIYPLLRYEVTTQKDHDLKDLFDKAIKIRKEMVTHIPFDGDSIDRELVRDIITILKPKRVIDPEIEHTHHLKKVIKLMEVA